MNIWNRIPPPRSVNSFGGLFSLRPPWLRFSIIWDVSVMLNFPMPLSPASKLNLLTPTPSAKLVTMCARVTGHRDLTLHALNIKDLHLSCFQAVFHIEASLKTNPPRNPTTVVSVLLFCENCQICVYTYLKLHLKHKKAIYSSCQLFISTQSPLINGVTKDLA